MPCYFIAGYSNKREPFFLQNRSRFFVAIINEEKRLSSHEWTCTHHIMIPKNFSHLFGKLFLKSQRKTKS